MKKVYLMKGMAAMALGLVVASCNKMDAFNPYAEQEAKQQEFTENFQSSVMNGQSIDQNQTWANTTTTQVSVTPSTSGTLKIYTANPIGSVVASLYTASVTAGTKTTFTVAKPADVSQLYAVVISDKGLISDILAFDATESSVDVNLNATASTSNRAPRRADSRPNQPDTIVRATLREPTDMPTAANADIKILEDATYEYGFEIDKSYYIAPNVTVTFTGQNAGINQKSKVYMAPGSKLVKTTGTLSIDIPTVVYNDGGTIEANNLEVKQGMLWNKGTIKLTGKLLLDQNNAQLYNASGCKIEANELEMNNNKQLLWNEGTIEIENEFYAHNSSASAVNYSTFKAGSFSLEAGGKFFNMTDGNVEIEETTTVGNSNSVWVNNSTFTTGVFSVDQGSNKAFNNCRLTCTEKFSMGKNDGSYFVLNGDASVITEDFDWNGDGYFWMGANSLLLVKDTLKSNNDDDNYGFYQYGDDYAVISAKAITTDNVDAQSRVCYFGKIYVDADSHFEMKRVTSISKNNYMKGDDVQFTNKQFTAPVPDAWKTETTCRPAYNPGNQREDEVAWYYYAFEDLGTTDDFDFNDVIIRVSAPVEGTSTVELVAAGGTLTTYVTYNDEVFNTTEVHQLFDGASTSQMINTGNGPDKKFKTLGTLENLPAGTNMANLPFGISAQGTNGQLTKVTQSVANIGKAPLVIVVAGYPDGDNAGRWFWPTERTMISAAYTDFGAWGANASSYTNWYTNYDSDKVYQWDDSKEQ